MSNEANAGVPNNSKGLSQFKIFLASPGDVPLERKLAREAIVHVASERRFRNRIDLEIIAWDQPGAAVAMEAGLTPQEAIAQGLPKPEECDLAVIVIWSRIGTQLPANFELKPDGSPYLSGTEWEYLNALKGYQTQRKPSVWVYRKKSVPNPTLNDPNYADIVDQWNKVENFFAGFINPDGSLGGGINHYETPDEFRQLFENHLRNRLDEFLESLPGDIAVHAPAKKTAISTFSGSPYPGLKAFTPEQANIYFGRGREVDQLLAHFADFKVRFVAVVGVSGSGKSSLVKAGLLPRLRSGIVGHAPWSDLLFTPGERGDNPFLAMAYALNAALNLTDQTEKDIARKLQISSENGEKYTEAEACLRSLLPKSSPNAELLLVIDQFEELFTQCRQEACKDFLAMLDDVVTLPRIRIIVTMRADFYEQAIRIPTIANLLRRDRGTFPLDPPGIGALHQMIVKPAEAAGLELQDGLAQRLLDEAGSGPGAMALIAYTLNQLYERGKSSQYLGIDAYIAFGGVKGAVEQRAKAALENLPKLINEKIDTVLSALFGALVEVNEQEVATRRRAQLELLSDDAKLIAERLIEARLLVSGQGEANQPMLEVAHEIVLSGWGRLRDWVKDHASAIRTRRDLEQAATEWDGAGQTSSALRTGSILKRYEGAAEPFSPIAKAYLNACRRRRVWFRSGLAGLGVLTAGFLVLLFHLNKSAYPPSLATKALLVEIGIWPVSTPNMVTVPAGSFAMGSENGDSDERPVHTIVFSRPFELGRYEVTFDEYDLFAAATGRAKPNDQGWGRGQRPVINVSWDDAAAYAQWLSERTGLHYRLPSEAEWEYAARAGTTKPRYWNETTEQNAEATDPACSYANVFDRQNRNRITSTYAGITWQPFNCADKFPFTAPVGQFKPNDWQVYDILGNVWEWTQDCYIGSYEDFPKDGTARETDKEACSRRVVRGGSWGFGPHFVRSADRDRFTPGNRGDDLGFRLARTL